MKTVGKYVFPGKLHGYPSPSMDNVVCTLGIPPVLGKQVCFTEGKRLRPMQKWTFTLGD